MRNENRWFQWATAICLGTVAALLTVHGLQLEGLQKDMAEHISHGGHLILDESGELQLDPDPGFYQEFVPPEDTDDLVIDGSTLEWDSLYVSPNSLDVDGSTEDIFFMLDGDISEPPTVLAVYNSDGELVMEINWERDTLDVNWGEGITIQESAREFSKHLIDDNIKQMQLLREDRDLYRDAYHELLRIVTEYTDRQKTILEGMKF